MPIQFRCTTCRKLLSVARRKAGQPTECPVCGAKTTVPTDLAGDPSGDSTPASNGSTVSVVAPVAVAAPTAAQVATPTAAPVATQLPVSTVTSEAALPKPATRPSQIAAKKIPPAPGHSGILEIDPDKLFGKSASKAAPHTGSSSAKELSDYFEAIDQAQAVDGSGSQAVVVPENLPSAANSWKLWVFSVLVVLAVASALVVGFRLLFG